MPAETAAARFRATRQSYALGTRPFGRLASAEPHGAQYGAPGRVRPWTAFCRRHLPSLARPPALRNRLDRPW